MKQKFAVFIDRDGTIVEEVDNLSKIEDLKIFPLAIKAVKLLNKYKIPAIVVTNQPVIARGWVDEQWLNNTHKEIIAKFKKGGAKIDRIYYCPHHPNANLEKYRVVCKCRKPGVGMLKQAAKDFKIDLKESYIVGNSFRDIEAGKKVGATTIAVKTGSSNFKDSKPHIKVKGLLEAVKLILEKEGLS